MDSYTNASSKPVVLPAPGTPFQIAWYDIKEAVRLAPVWLHSGWINVVWRYRRTRLGPFWHTLGLATFILVMGTIWSTLLHQSPVHYFRYVTTSLIVWGLIASFITEGTGVLVAGQSTVQNMRFPVIAFSLSHVWRAFLLFCHQFVFYIIMMAGTLFWPGWSVLLAIPGLLLLLANGIWMSLLSGMISLRWRDAALATASAMQIAIFVTPVFWPKEMLGPRLGMAADFNPLYHLVMVMRGPLLGTPPSLADWIWAVCTLVIGSLVTLWVYGRNRDRIPYWY
jgi:ABC-2 type transport system permease protein